MPPPRPTFFAYLDHVKYIGSFPVAGSDQSTRADFVRAQLEQMREAKKKKPVLLVISLAGVKACSPDGKSVYMAHALRRISYATCDPEHCQFSFLAREPKGHFSLQYCHSFLTQSSEQAEELNTIVGNAFRMAYAAQLQKSQRPRLTDLIHQQRGLYEGVTDSPLSTPPSSCDNSPLHRPLSTQHLAVDGLRNNSNNTNSLPRSPFANRKERHSGYNRLWAKQLLSRVRRHPNPHPHPKEPVQLDRVVGMNVLSGIGGSPCRRIHLDQANGNLSPPACHGSPIPGSPRPPKPRSIPGLSCTTSAENARNNSTRSGGLRGEEPLLTPSSTSSDDTNSPTELNSYKRLVDKPPLIKRLTMAIDSSGYEEELRPLVKDTSGGNRALSSGYVNEGMGSSTDNIMEEVPVKDSGFTNNFANEASPTQSLKTLNGLKVRPLPSPPFPESYMDQSSDGSRRSSRSSEGQGSFLPEATLVIQESRERESPAKTKRTSQVSGSSCSSSSSPPPPPERYDSLQTDTEEGELKKAPWFQAGVPREIALEILAQEPVGAFMVRESTTKPGCYALSLRVPREFQPTGIAHYLIMKTNKGYKIKGFTKEFCTLTALITHHSVMPELLPCPLSLARYNPNFSKHDSNQDFADIDDDPDYNALSDFRKMMADLNV